ncbi:hypothetical protein B0H13DRAFT_2326850 [Mycena leptocephala]|nr:hypothetical protein B0H13DRAFT_2326850 [Mycena leptocephala]
MTYRCDWKPCKRPPGSGVAGHIKGYITRCGGSIVYNDVPTADMYKSSEFKSVSRLTTFTTVDSSVPSHPPTTVVDSSVPPHPPTTVGTMANSTRKKGLGVRARPPRVRSSTNVFTDNGARRQLLTSVKPKASQVIRDRAQKEMQEHYDVLTAAAHRAFNDVRDIADPTNEDPLQWEDVPDGPNDDIDAAMNGRDGFVASGAEENSATHWRMQSAGSGTPEAKSNPCNLSFDSDYVNHPMAGVRKTVECAGT